ncbi:Aldehyde dehydrogenase [Mortierella sp. AD011]|nr:Aldehyde dehydrogenase [Mortierella sp. AD010]KAF9379610.1 Aldehyde dehydrogenase [Mortierella sp. AD011]KAF9379613.1 Aldehyde dehydrogenase [Mortierella sp. AD011]
MAESSLQYSTTAEIKQAIETNRRTFKSGVTKSFSFRQRQLERLWCLLDDNTDELCQAVAKDLHKHKTETMMEILAAKEEINEALNDFRKWAKDEKVTPALVNRFGTVCYKRKEPKGSVLIIAPWNYPVNLAVSPLIGAIAAGCTAVIKPSEVSPHTAKVLTNLYARYLDNSAYTVVNGGVPETTLLLEHKWNHIFYTGNGVVAKVIMRAAAEHFTPVTLELGGKSPAYIDEDANMAVVSRRIAFGKTINAGQTCIAPDYLLMTAKAEEKFIPELKKAIGDMFGEDIQASKDYGRIINNRQFQRLSKLLNERQSGDIVIGGKSDEKDLFFTPTVLTNVNRDDKIMEDEIFGPILPIIRVTDVDDAIEYINSKDDPLVLYIFTDKKKVTNKIMDSTRSGGILVNDTLMHVAENSLPFGGIGPSGMGSYHGKNTFDTFTHVRATMVKNLNPLSEHAQASRYAPFTDRNLRIIRLVIESVPKFKQSFLMKNSSWVVALIAIAIGYWSFR